MNYQIKNWQYKLGAALILSSLTCGQLEMPAQSETTSLNSTVALQETRNWSLRTRVSSPKRKGIKPSISKQDFSLPPSPPSLVPSPFFLQPGQVKAQDVSALPQVVRRDFYVTSDPGIRIFVREVFKSGKSDNAGVPVLLIHGGGAGGVASFDLDVPGYSLAADMATAGHPVYIMNVRGWERSTRPASLNEPAENNPPAVTSQEAIRDIHAGVDEIRSLHPDDGVALVGWATGGHWAGMYASQNNDKVSHLVMLNTLYGVNAPWEPREAFEDPKQPGEFNRNAGAYRLATAEALLANWDEKIPVSDKSQWREPKVAKAYQQTALASDPTSSTRTPPSIRIPGAYRLESYNLSQGQKYWEAADITVPTLVIRGEKDHWSRPEDLKALKAELANAPIARTVTIPNGTHFLFNDKPERGRDRFLQETLSFLSRK